MIRSALFLFTFFLTIPFTWAQPPDNQSYTLFLVGDCGELTGPQEHVGKVLRDHVSKDTANKMVLYLGDNVYPFGLTGEGQLARERGEKILETQVGWIKDLEARGIFIPGNHDWQHWNRDGWKYLINQQEWFDSLNDEHIQLLPRDGCPGPVEIQLNRHAVLVIIDSQWLLHAHDKPGEESDCSAKTPSEFMTMLMDILERHEDRRVIIAAHHPLITDSDHGGFFTMKDHLFPLTDLYRNLYLPLPVVGSIYPVYRKIFGHPQDIKHPIYNQYSKLMRKLLAQYPGSVYVAGHEHVLEYIVKDSTHYLVSGSGSKTTHVKKRGHTRYGDGVNGFMKLHISESGVVSLEIWQADNDFPEGKLVFEGTFPRLNKEIKMREDAVESFVGKYVRVKASTQYGAGKSRKKFLGANYRDTWEQEIEVPVFDISTEHGGLKIIQKGGGQQTLSLRLSDSTGREYVLRSVEKNPERAVPEMFRGTFAQDLVQDQISASHPYGAIVLPYLANAAGIYHTNPKLVFIPDDPRFGKYQKQFANMLALYEERPDEDWSDASYFGNSKNIIGTNKVLERLEKDNDNSVDQHFVLRSRLFDLWIGDWDRHDDQWRWATIKQKKGEVYRPIPRDRDQAFFVNEGILPKIWSRKWAMPKFEGFDEKINWPSGLSFNARYFDRSFLNGLSEEEWINTAKDLQKRLTDEVIEQAIKKWPPEVYKLDGEEVIRKLKARRERLVADAVSLYKVLAQEVDVVGSGKDEHFEVTRMDDGKVDVKVSKLKKEGDTGKELYHRVFKKGETKEIRLFGLGGNDKFDVKGETNKSILIRIIGGRGNDTLLDESHVQGIRKHTLFYDLKEANYVVAKGEVGNRTSKNPDINNYDRKSFRFNRLAPLIYGNFNPDDGLFIGGGLLYQTEGFRKNPFKQRHILLGSIAPLTNSYNFLYRGDFVEVIGRWGVEINADVKSPNYVNNFFGLGNETRFDHSIQYYRFRFEELKLESHLTRRFGNITAFKIGPALQRVEIEQPDERERYIHEEFAPTLSYNLYEEYNSFGGLSWSFVMDNRNDKRITTRGSVLSISGQHLAGLDRMANDFSSLEGALSLYHSFNIPARMTFAARVGGGQNFGDYAFYQAQILSGRTELRGFRKTRFYGDSKFYSNFEMRMRIANLQSYLFPANFGLLGFYDVGRVWYQNEQGIDPSAEKPISTKWHKGFGAGIWFTPFNITVLSVEIGRSEEGTLGYVRLGFLF